MNSCGKGMDEKQISKLMALMLRHKPEKFGLRLDPEGWVSAKKLTKALNKETKLVFGLSVIREIVERDDKKRYSLKGSMKDPLIRANQGHSTPSVKLNYDEKVPPEFLYHGTHHKIIDVILQEGLKKMSRHHVHLSADFATAINVGRRRGRPHVLVLASREMYKNNYKFYLSDNGVWLTEEVPKLYLISTWVERRQK